VARNSSGPSSSSGAGVRPSRVRSQMDWEKSGIGQEPGQIGGEVTGGEGVDSHAVSAPDRGQVPGEVDQGRLGGVVSGHRAAGANEAVHGRDVDHAGRGRGPQEVRGQPGQVQDADQVDLDHSLQVIKGLLVQWPVIAGACVVDQHVEPAMGARVFGEPLPVTRVGDVTGERFDPGAALSGQLFEEVGAAGGHHDVGARRMQHPGEPGPQAGRSPCDQGNPAIQPPPPTRLRTRRRQVCFAHLPSACSGSLVHGHSTGVSGRRPHSAHEPS
jgi:hypothetical protein